MFKRFFLLVFVLFTSFLIGVIRPCPVMAQDKGTDISKVIELKDIHLTKGIATGIKIMRDNNRPVAFMIKAAKGFAVCGHFNLKTMEKSGISVIQFVGVKSIEEAVDAKVVDMTSQAKNLGVKKGWV
ncbi:hypothetical protein BuS5_00403 [Desulfosarcina sp. BuS5]|nr:hypothetical protein BuS5_00403 [Desulfosarcina sp. BuS5]